MKKIILCFLIVLLCACSKRKFFDPPAFDGMMGNVESVATKLWSYPPFSDSTTQAFVAKNSVVNYSKDGKLKSIEVTIFNPASGASSLMQTINTYADYSLKKQDIVFYDSSSDSSFLILRYEPVSKDTTIIHWETRNVQDTARVFVEYDFEKQTKTETSRDRSGKIKERVTTFYKDHLPIKIISETAAFTTTLLSEYDDKSNLVRSYSTTLYRNPKIEKKTLETLYQYTEFDERGNWTERRIVANNETLNLETREIEYRE